MWALNSFLVALGRSVKKVMKRREVEGPETAKALQALLGGRPQPRHSAGRLWGLRVLCALAGGGGREPAVGTGFAERAAWRQREEQAGSGVKPRGHVCLGEPGRACVRGGSVAASRGARFSRERVRHHAAPRGQECPISDSCLWFGLPGPSALAGGGASVPSPSSCSPHRRVQSLKCFCALVLLVSYSRVYSCYLLLS